MNRLAIRKIGNSLGVILPKEVLEAFRVDEGDVLYLVESRDGLRLTPYDPEFEADLEAGRAILKRYRNALHKLGRT